MEERRFNTSANVKIADLYEVFSRMYEDGHFHRPYEHKLDCFDKWFEDYCVDFKSRTLKSGELRDLLLEIRHILQHIQ